MRPARTSEHERGGGFAQWCGGQRGVHISPQLRDPLLGGIERCGVAQRHPRRSGRLSLWSSVAAGDSMRAAVGEAHHGAPADPKYARRFVDENLKFLGPFAGRGDTVDQFEFAVGLQ